MGMNFETTVEMKAIKVKDYCEVSYDKINSKNSFVRANNAWSYLFIKRTIDIIGSIVGILMLLPIFILVSLIIKLQDGGPAIFVQNRVGINGKVFKMYKFRSMKLNAEEELKKLHALNEAKGPLFKIKEDPRVTKFGKFIRKTSIDELPQLFNILLGHMTIVGPRPPLISEVEQYNEHQKLRLSVKPGLTCFWQISGRSNLGFDEMVELDIKYIEERNLLLDIKIILLTIPAVLFNKGAY